MRAHAQAELSLRTEELRHSNESKAEAELHLRAEYHRQKVLLTYARARRRMQAYADVC
jgi:hypothetical protein